jgi:hypothetical protein
MKQSLIARSAGFETDYDAAFKVLVRPFGTDRLLAKLNCSLLYKAPRSVACQISFAVERN